MGSHDTIAAISTAWGEAGIAIVRLSGPDSVRLARSVLRFKTARFPPPRTMGLATLTDDAGAVDQVLAVRFEAPASYTGEEVVEIHTHGGTLVAQLCLENLIRRGARLGEPGEFTKRAFLNGRLDLSQTEGVLGVIRSRSAEALRAAARTMGGELSVFAAEIREELLTLQGRLEVGLDFPEGELPFVGDAELRSSIATLKLGLEDLLDRCSVGLLLREGVRVVLSGTPNVGKSSLLNALLKQARAIVTALPGTTRDVIEETLTHKGVPIRLADTAGLRAPADAIEASGIERAKAELERSDVCLWILDGSVPLADEDRDYIRHLSGRDPIVVLNKADLPQRATEEDVRAVAPEIRVLSLSSKTGAGIDALKDAILSVAHRSGTLDAALNVTARQLAEVREALTLVADAETAVREQTGQDVVAGLLGSSRECLDRLLGKTCDDALLDAIFSRFCVGK